MKLHKSLYLCFAVIVSLCAPALGQTTVTFEDLPLALSGYYNGDPGTPSPIYGYDGSFTTPQGATFGNTYNRDDFGGGDVEFWFGWAYTNHTDTTTPGFNPMTFVLENQYSAFAGSGAGGSNNYGVSSGNFDPLSNDNSITIPGGQSFQSIDITNTTYAALAMRDGDSFSKKFGGISGNDPDFFTLTITGLSGGPTGTVVGTIDVPLADYTFGNNSLDYILDDWLTVSLASLVGADTLTFSYDSSDVGMFGINTPLYFAADNLVFGSSSSSTVPEPSSVVAMLIVAAAASLFYQHRRTRMIA